MAWHVDPCRRYSVVLGGDQLTIEYRDGSASDVVPVHRGWQGGTSPSRGLIEPLTQALKRMKNW